MADIKWSAFPSTATPGVGDTLVGLHSGSNYRFTGLTVPFSLSVGGTGAALTASNGGVVYSTATTLAILANSGANGNVLLSNNAAAPSWSSATYPVSVSANQILYGSSSNVISGLASANNGVLVTSAGGVPSIGSTLPAAVQGNITAVGIITSGTWGGNSIGLAYGGTNANLTASNGGIFYSTATAGAILSGTATANQVLLSGASGAPSWSTATYPPTTTINQLLYSSSANVIAGLSTANSAVLVTNSSGVPSFSSTMTNGQVIIGSTSATPTAATLTAGTGISITNGAGSITIASTASGMAWSTISGTTQAAAVDSGYIVGNASQTTVTLPATAAIGSKVALCGSATGTAGWVLAANTGQTIKIGSSSTASAGNLTSANQYDNVVVVCIVADTTWMVQSVMSTGVTVN